MGTRVRSININCVACWVVGLVYGVEDDLWIDTVCVSNTISVLGSVLQRHCIAMCWVFFFGAYYSLFQVCFATRSKSLKRCVCQWVPFCSILWPNSKHIYFTCKFLDLERSLGSWIFERNIFVTCKNLLTIKKDVSLSVHSAKGAIDILDILHDQESELLFIYYSLLSWFLQAVVWALSDAV